MKGHIFVKEYLKRGSINDLFLLVVLIGLLPAIEDFSLFALFGFAINDFHVFEEVRLLYSIPIILLPVALVFAIYKKIPYWFFGLLPALYAGYMILVHQLFDLTEGEHGTVIGIIHFLCYQIAFLYFIVTGRLRSLPFWITLILITILLDFQHLILFATYTLLIRFLFLAIRQNIYIFQETGLKKTLRLGLKSFLYWSPLLMIIVPSAIISDKLNKESIDKIYEGTFVSSTCEKRKYKRDQFEKDLQLSLLGEVDSLKHNIELQAKALEDSVNNATDSLAFIAGQSFENSVPPTLPVLAPVFKTEDCFFLNFPCHLKNSLKYEMNERYKHQRRAIKGALVGQVNKTSEGMNIAADSVNTFISSQVNKQVAPFKKSLTGSIQSLFDTFLFYDLLMDILFGFLILKSFLYVFARVAFSSSNENYVTLMEPEKAMPMGSLNKCGNEYTIPAADGKNFFVSRSFEPSGRAPKYSLPQWRSALVARLSTGNYAMNKMIMGSGQDDVTFRAMGGNEFVEWNLKESEEVVFHFKNFVGMSESIKLSAVVSLRITSLLMGRIIFTTAKGPGKLILLTTGEPITSEEQKANASVATSRILAWQKNTRFNVESELNILDVFMSGVYMKKQELDLILIDADVKGRAGKGIFRFIKNFLLPV